MKGTYEPYLKEGTKESFLDSESCFYRSSNGNASGQGKTQENKNVQSQKRIEKFRTPNCICELSHNTELSQNSELNHHSEQSQNNELSHNNELSYNSELSHNSKPSQIMS